MRLENASLIAPALLVSAPWQNTRLATNSMIVIDTNIWIYSHDTRDLRKQAIAQQLIASATALLPPWQVGCEFIAAARKLSSVGFVEADAWDALEDMQQLADAIALPDPLDWKAAR